MMKCPKCNWENKDDATRCAVCGTIIQGEVSLSTPQNQQAQNSYQLGGPQYQSTPSGGLPPYGSECINNTSGMGSTAFVPAEVRGWNWGAFLMSWIWAIAHNTWIGLVALLPYVGFIMCIVLGVKGSEWAWQNRRWESVEQFKATQRIWAYWGLALTILWVVATIVAIMVPAFMGAREAAQMHPF